MSLAPLRIEVYQISGSDADAEYIHGRPTLRSIRIVRRPCDHISLLVALKLVRSVLVEMVGIAWIIGIGQSSHAEVREFQCGPIWKFIFIGLAHEYVFRLDVLMDHVLPVWSRGIRQSRVSHLFTTLCHRLDDVPYEGPWYPFTVTILALH